MKKLFTLLALLCLGMTVVSAKAIYTLELDQELTLAQAKECTTGFVITDGTKILNNSTNVGDPKVSFVELNNATYGYLYKMVPVTVDENQYVKLYAYNADATGIAAGTNYSGYGDGGNLSPVSWGDLWVAPETKPNGRDYENGSCYEIIEAVGGGYYIKSVGANSMLNGASATKDNVSGTVYHFYTIKKTHTANQVYTFAKTTLAQAITTEKPVVIMNSEAKVMNGAWGQWSDGLQMHSQSDFDEKFYQVKVEAIDIDGAENTYTIKLNENGNYNRYLQASQWGHAFLSSDLKSQNGNDGENCAVWTILSAPEGKYSIRSLGVAQDKIRALDDDGYLTVNGENVVRIDSKNPVDWEFYTIEGSDIVPLVPTSVTVTIDEALTYSTSKILDFSGVTEAEAYIATACDGEKVTMTKVRGAVPAGTGLVIVGNGNVEIPFAATATVNVSANKLVATTVATNVPVGSYVLAGTGANLGWYSIGANPANLAAGKAYLTVPAGAKKQLQMVWGEDVTAANAVEAQTTEDGAWYTIAGVKVAAPTVSGLYIHNGKKVNVTK